MRHLLLTLLLLLPACGFQPLYDDGGSAGGVQQTLAAIDIAPIPDRLGQIMRQRLREKLNGEGAPKYRLYVTLKQEKEGFGYRPDAAITQEQLTMWAFVRLVPLSSEETVAFEEEMRARTSYDLVLSDFASLTQREDAARRLVQELAERIHRKLALHFTKNSDES